MKNVTRFLFARINSAMPCPVFLRFAPQRQAYPYAVLTPVSHTTFDRGMSEGGADDTTWQLDVYALDDYNADALCEKAVEVLEIPTAGYTLGEAEVIYSAVTGIEDGTDLIDSDGEAQVIRRVVEFEIQYN